MRPVRCTQCHQAVRVVRQRGLACGCATFPQDLLVTLVQALAVGPVSVPCVTTGLLALGALPAQWPVEDLVAWVWEAVHQTP